MLLMDDETKAQCVRGMDPASALQSWDVARRKLCALATFLGTATKHLAEGLKEGCFSSFGLQFQDTAHPNRKVWL